MFSEELALLGVEIRRHVVSRRYVLVVAVFTIFVWNVTTQMAAYGANTGVTYNAWDVFLGVLGGTANSLSTAVILPMLLVFLLGSTVQEDVLSGYSLLVQTRLTRKNSYWWVKIASTLCVVAVVVGSLYAISLGIGMLRGFALVPAALSAAGGHPDAWGIAKGVPPVYYSLRPNANVVVHGLLVAVYFVFAYFAIVVLVIGTTVRSRNLYAPFAFGALLTASGLAIAFATSDLVFGFSLQAALTESTHRPLPVLDAPPGYAVPWSHSIALMSVLLCVGLVVGWILTPTRVSRARGPRPRRARRSLAGHALCIAVLVLALSLAGCAPADFAGGTMPQIEQVEIGELSDADIDYLRAISIETIGLRDAVDDLNSIFGPENLHSDDLEMTRLLDERLANLGERIDAAESLEVTPSLLEWYRAQYEPGLNELQYVVDNLSALNAAGDHVGVRMCLKHVGYASAYLGTAGMTVAPFAP